MRSTRQPPRTAAEDLTARARIRAAAVLRFAHGGFGASLRSIAADAEVSAALVIHHFGSKAELRRACDVQVLDEIRLAKLETLTTAAGGRFFEHFSTAHRFAPSFAYVLRSVQEGGALATTFVDSMVEDALEYVTAGVAAGVVVPSRDEHARARYLVLSSLGASMLSVTLDPPEAPADLAGAMRHHLDATTLPYLELCTEGLLTTRQVLEDYLTHVGAPSPAGGEEDADRDRAAGRPRTTRMPPPGRGST